MHDYRIRARKRFVCNDEVSFENKPPRRRSAAGELEKRDRQEEKTGVCYLAAVSKGNLEEGHKKDPGLILG